MGMTTNKKHDEKNEKTEKANAASAPPLDARALLAGMAKQLKETGTLVAEVAEHSTDKPRANAALKALCVLWPMGLPTHDVLVAIIDKPAT
jgi:hypothetical protein